MWRSSLVDTGTCMFEKMVTPGLPWGSGSILIISLCRVLQWMTRLLARKALLGMRSVVKDLLILFSSLLLCP